MRPQNTMSTVMHFVTGFLFLSMMGCATIMKGDNETVVIETDPAGAKVSVGKYTCHTPCDLELPRGFDLKMSIEKDGYQTENIVLNGHSWDGYIYGNIIFLVGFPIGVIVDFANGMAYDYSPGELDLKLKPLTKAAILKKPSDLQ